MQSDKSKWPREGTVEHALWRFAMLANKTSLHPRDWKRFYEFIILAHSRRVGWDAYEVQSRLVQYGFEGKRAEKLASAYWHGRCVLHMRKARPLNESYRQWMARGGTAWT
jgi:hypothetical protein